MCSSRFINTRELLECRNSEEVRACLDRMESLAERMLKTAADDKASRNKARMKGKTAAGRSRSQVRQPNPPGGHNVVAGTPSSSSRGPPPKRSREGSSPAVVEAAMASPFPFPLCFTKEDFFDKYPPVVTDAELEFILEQDLEVRREQQTRDLVGVIMMMECFCV